MLWNEGFVTFLNEKAIKLILEYGILEKLGAYIIKGTFKSTLRVGYLKRHFLPLSIGLTTTMLEDYFQEHFSHECFSIKTCIKESRLQSKHNFICS